MMEEKELKQLAIEISENKVFGTFHIKDCTVDKTTMVFMPLLFMEDESKQELIDNEITHIYEYVEKAGPRSINGMPVFMSFRTISKTDWGKTCKYIKEYEIKVKSFLDKNKNKEPVGPTLFDGKNNEDNK